MRQNGPLRIDQWMDACLQDPVHGYYRHHPAIGRSADFITAPEISQLFGEMIGFCFLDYWMRAGQPDQVQLVECGPGRGQLMADLLRVTRHIPAFQPTIHLVESNETLRREQIRSLAGVDIIHHETLEEIPQKGPLFLIANEFLDALPVRQFQRMEDHWQERGVDWSEQEGRFVPSLLQQTADPDLELPAQAAVGSIHEISTAQQTFLRHIAHRLARHQGLALMMDYGSLAAPVTGDTLQAVRHHAFVSPFDTPGDCDLTCHVDFAALVDLSGELDDVTISGPVDMGQFLRQLGIVERCTQLSQNTRADARARLAAGMRRLVSPEGMGTLFKALAITAKLATHPAGFQTSGQESFPDSTAAS